jgi:hypothetical protein
MAMPLRNTAADREVVSGKLPRAGAQGRRVTVTAELYVDKHRNRTNHNEPAAGPVEPGQ